MSLEKFPVLHTSRLDLVEVIPAHAADMFRLFTDEKVTAFYNVKPFKKVEDLQEVIEMLSQRFREQTGIRWGIALKGQDEIIGNIGFNSFTADHRAFLAYALLPPYWGNGYLTEAIRLVTEFGFEKLGINRIEAEVMPGNIASERVLEKNGFVQEGLLREWIWWYGKRYDVNMYALLKTDKQPTFL